MSDASHRAFFGDRERDFRLTPSLVMELERMTGAGIGALFRRVAVTVEFRHADLAEIIRLGLIGGGETPENAAVLVAAYVASRPILETYPIAVAILEHLWSGPPKPSLAPDAENTLRAETIP